MAYSCKFFLREDEHEIRVEKYCVSMNKTVQSGKYVKSQNIGDGSNLRYNQVQSPFYGSENCPTEVGRFRDHMVSLGRESWCPKFSGLSILL